MKHRSMLHQSSPENYRYLSFFVIFREQSSREDPGMLWLHSSGASGSDDNSRA